MNYERPALHYRGTFGGFLAPTSLGSTEMDWRVKRLLRYVELGNGRLAGPLDQVTETLKLGISGAYAARLFKANVGVGFRAYAKHTRLSFAAEQLKFTQLPVKAIAADLGYQSSWHFQRQFRHVFRTTACNFRKLHRQKKTA